MINYTRLQNVEILDNTDRKVELSISEIEIQIDSFKLHDFHVSFNDTHCLNLDEVIKKVEQLYPCKHNFGKITFSVDGGIVLLTFNHI